MVCYCGFPGKGRSHYNAVCSVYLSEGYGIGACSCHGMAVPIQGQLLCTYQKEDGSLYVQSMMLDN